MACSVRYLIESLTAPPIVTFYRENRAGRTDWPALGFLVGIVS
jgi:hypothetical protein